MYVIQVFTLSGISDLWRRILVFYSLYFFSINYFLNRSFDDIYDSSTEGSLQKERRPSMRRLCEGARGKLSLERDSS